MSGSIKLPAFEAGWMLRGALAAASKDDVTPVLCAVLWQVENGRATATSTDRYRVHQLHSERLIGDDVADTPAGGQFLMGRDQASLLLKSLPRRGALAQALVELTWVDAEPLPQGFAGRIPRRYVGSIRFDVTSDDSADAERLTHETAQVRGHFPPVDRLFPSEGEEGEPAVQLGLAPQFLWDTRWLRSGHGSLRFVVPKTGDRDTRKTGGSSQKPLLVVNTEGTARAIIQPVALGAFGEWKEYGA